ncbi:helix-turn-helix transcriptional regulator [Rhodopirellula halodulae]|uniref:helix-turn-helix transcriptional regulator n=1 Tax=Rhodopirellula halodulae TaxID=2894198 RepID=UPI0036F25423
MNGRNKNDRLGLIDIKEVARLFAVSVSTIKRRRDRGEIPKPIRNKGTARYKKAEILKLIDDLES